MKKLNYKRHKYGELNCVTADLGNEPRNLAVFCHGYGAPGTDLVGLAEDLFSEMTPEMQSSWRMVFPEAPLSLAAQGIPGGRAWWVINMEKLLQLAASGQWDLVRDVEPPGIDSARKLLVATIEAARAELPADSKLIVAGFSQGAMLAMDVSVRGLDRSPDGLILFSGTLICESVWRDAATSRLSGVPVIQSHGTLDPVLPFMAAEWLRQLLISAGAKLEFLPFPGPHTISGEAIAASGRLLSS